MAGYRVERSRAFHHRRTAIDIKLSWLSGCALTLSAPLLFHGPRFVEGIIDRIGLAEAGEQDLRRRVVDEHDPLHGCPPLPFRHWWAVYVLLELDRIFCDYLRTKH